MTTLCCVALSYVSDLGPSPEDLGFQGVDKLWVGCGCAVDLLSQVS